MKDVKLQVKNIKTAVERYKMIYENNIIKANPKKTLTLFFLNNLKYLSNLLVG